MWKDAILNINPSVAGWTITNASCKISTNECEFKWARGKTGTIMSFLNEFPDAQIDVKNKSTARTVVESFC